MAHVPHQVVVEVHLHMMLIGWLTAPFAALLLYACCFPGLRRVRYLGAQ